MASCPRPFSFLLLLTALALTAAPGCDDGATDGDSDVDADAARDADQDGPDGDPQPCETDGECTNYLFCDGEERCVDNLCAAGTPPECDDDDDCTNDSCSDAREECRHILIEIDDDEDGYASAECRGPDCDDSDPTINPETREICNGIDDNCNDRTDEPGVLSMAAESAWPADLCLAWSGTVTGAAWSDEINDEDREVYFTTVESDGATIGATTRITSAAGVSDFPHLVWADDSWALVYSDDRGGAMDIYYVRLGPDGSPMGAEVALTSTSAQSRHAALVWTGSQLAMVWAEETEDSFAIHFLRFDRDGSTPGSVVEVTSAQMTSTIPAMVWNGTHYGIVWTDQRTTSGEVYFARISAAGAKVGGDVMVDMDTFLGSRPVVAWSGSEFGVAWSDQRDGDYDIYFARLSGAGSVIGSVVALTDNGHWSSAPALIWADDAYSMVFRDDREGVDAVFWARYSSTGVRESEELRVSRHTGRAENPSTVFTGTFHAFGWGQWGDDTDWPFYAQSCPGS